MSKQEYIKELKEEIAYEKEMIAKGDHVEERKQEVKDMQAELNAVLSGKMRWSDDETN
ncbi:MAG: hypothetical protein J6Q96_02845 [Bacteroidales bacterium]|nr:hypothetical protein [Bacteroidales bacterium]